VREGGSLRDISPTMLGLMEIELPKQMTGGDLRVVAG
jgi:2,3-bisphosphoglycerate-independent phosphoglycerate mutase